MRTMNYVGLDVHKKTISHCVKTKGGRIRDKGTIPATRDALDDWLASVCQATR